MSQPTQRETDWDKFALAASVWTFLAPICGEILALTIRFSSNKSLHSRIAEGKMHLANAKIQLDSLSPTQLEYIRRIRPTYVEDMQAILRESVPHTFIWFQRLNPYLLLDCIRLSVIMTWSQKMQQSTSCITRLVNS